VIAWNCLLCREPFSEGVSRVYTDFLVFTATSLHSVWLENSYEVNSAMNKDDSLTFIRFFKNPTCNWGRSISLFSCHFPHFSGYAAFSCVNPGVIFLITTYNSVQRYRTIPSVTVRILDPLTCEWGTKSPAWKSGLPCFFSVDSTKRLHPTSSLPAQPSPHFSLTNWSARSPLILAYTVCRRLQTLGVVDY